jgi:hypothetical protein
LQASSNIPCEYHQTPNESFSFKPGFKKRITNYFGSNEEEEEQQLMPNRATRPESPTTEEHQFSFGYISKTRENPLEEVKRSPAQKGSRNLRLIC